VESLAKHDHGVGAEWRERLEDTKKKLSEVVDKVRHKAPGTT
jgi:hypothetical protein